MRGQWSNDYGMATGPPSTCRSTSRRRPPARSPARRASW
ncbi:expressed unknown protein [Ectocarpus siliculosus]|uniref:Uncharacterized protein n=1 Tax=Ectocarpus siliculosus TaxID=2880 RepID=D8LJU9_ECTSI|nr:expressed unknown protein [Ectocarpus siliculosus]|eukprot:CBN76000.1 expressed unknown protein [Ectocarpus siliculosus]